MKTVSQRGVTLIETVVALALIAILASLAQFGFSDWTINSRIRTTAESLQNGVQMARVLAVQRNTPMNFSLVDTLTADCARATDGRNWIISLDNPEGKCDAAPSDSTTPRIQQARPAAEVGGAVSIAATVSNVAFSGLGRPSGPLTIDVQGATGSCLPQGSVRCLRMMLSASGSVRICDPSLDSAGSDIRRC
ncbi:type IV fimbrial biogenesis protein FimT [Noviherbaspirillum humi]|uniref:Type II secretion system protein H n=1 Tax=Noviherbaspirillum humi TaxID=1688639 RepID=A0A239LJL6_9BURK|nr:GspH/FimT family pseudopilin [Noviherbaspirillum humi]SNT29754.1 type IV fimbrial biogenesis protein FimT [Noviherbaspirillum humi]